MTYVGRMAGSINSQRLLLTIDQYASSPSHRVYFYAGLAVSSLVVAVASTHSCLPTEGWLKLSRPGCLVL